MVVLFAEAHAGGRHVASATERHRPDEQREIREIHQHQESTTFFWVLVFHGEFSDMFPTL